VVIPQDGFAWRFEWGADGLGALAPAAGVVVLIDVLRFTTAVSVAVDGTMAAVPVTLGPESIGAAPWRLSPRWIREHPPGSRLEVASANGAALAAAAVRAGVPHVLAGCFRNATAVARAAVGLAPWGVVAVVAAGEGRRPAGEDLLGAGAVLAALDPAGAISAPCCSPEAAAARAAFVSIRSRVGDVVGQCDSARELVERGFGDDVAEAAHLDASATVPVLRDGAFVPL
jgi:2-phosphosulfolactate phosphatase